MPGPQKKPLPSNFEVHPDDNKRIRCVICQDYDVPSAELPWISHTSSVNHNKSRGHVTNVERHAHQHWKQGAEAAAAVALYAHVEEVEVTPLGPVPNAPRPEMH
ncbi:hypothetical protein JB92DRAFT_2281793 [Gautieria morchelliformis]|nr:hypothetical protein JB92DRAFT_2281793 [Gautieria morchelliformis]